jgi:hypothetical protein
MQFISFALNRLLSESNQSSSSLIVVQTDDQKTKTDDQTGSDSSSEEQETDGIKTIETIDSITGRRVNVDKRNKN